jgi:hypothetical protein
MEVILMLKKIISLLLLGLMTLSSLSSCGILSKPKAQNLIDSFETEISPNIILVTNDDTLIIDGIETSFPNMPIEITHTVVEFNEKIYCVEESEALTPDDENYGFYKSKAYIYSIDIKSNEKQILYTHYIAPYKSEVPYFGTSLSWTYGNRCIAFYDGLNTFAYEIDTNTVKEIPPEEYYSYSDDLYRVNLEKDDSLTVSDGINSITIDMQYIMERHEPTRKLMELCLANNLFRKEDSVFGESNVFFINAFAVKDEIYIDCCPFNYSDWILSYDFESDSFRLIYASSESRRIHIIPKESIAKGEEYD